jgi:hypothetical protein
LDVEHEEIVALTTIIVNMDLGFFCRIRGVDGLPQNCEVAARSPPLAAGRLDAQRPDVRQFHVLAMRPIYHQFEHRVKAHIFVAALALLIQRLLQRRLADAGVDFSAERAMQLYPPCIW